MKYILPLFLVGCSTPGIDIRTVEVPIEVPVSCVSREDIPTTPPRVGDKLTGDAVKDLSIVSVSALELRAAFGEAVAILEACVK